MAVDPKQRIVVSMPLTTIWNQDGDLNAKRIRELGVEDIRTMLRQNSVQFVIANLGSPMNWIDPDLSLDFWRRVAKERIVSPDSDGFSLDNFPHKYCYCASL